MITISSDPEMLNTARLAQCEDLQVTKNETRKVWTKRFCDPNCQRADSAHLQSLARLVFNSALRTDDCIMHARIMHTHGIHGIHVQHISTRIRMSVIPSQHIASPYRYISLQRLQWLQETFRLPILKFIVRWSEDDGTMGRSDVATCNSRNRLLMAHRGTPSRITWWERKLVAWRCKLHTSFSPKNTDVEIQTIGLYRTIVKL